MIFRGINEDSDWNFGKGKQTYFINAQAIATNIKTRLLSFFGDCFFDTQAGIDWIRLLSSSGTATEIKLSCRASILQAYGVIRINRLDVVYDREERTINITYDIDTIYTQNLTQTLGVPNA